MKSLMILTFLVPFFAQAEEPEVQYLSWCQDNNVVSENDKGEIVVKAVCGEDVCTELLRPMGRGYVSYAVCR